MNSQCFIHAGRAKYYLDLGREDYYTGGHDPRGKFSGSGAAHFGLEGDTIDRNDVRFERLMSGKTPDGQHEMRKGGRTYRHYKDKTTGKLKNHKPVCAIDNTFSAPKDVSLLWALAPDKEMRDKIHEIHKAAVQEAVDHLNSKVLVRSNKRLPNGSRQMEYHEAKGIFATFDHTTSRELDPQLHSHVLLLNAAIRQEEDGKDKYGAVCGKEVLKNRYIAGQIYQNHLRRELERQLGVETYNRPFSDEKGMSFGINGITQEVKERFSLRSAQIEKEIDAAMTGAQVRAVVLKTRQSKQEISPDKLFGEWKERGTAMGFDIYNVIAKHNDFQHQSVAKKAVIKVGKKLDEQLKKFDAKDFTTDEDKLFRDVAQTLDRKAEWRLEKQHDETEKLAQKDTRKTLWIERKIREGLTKKEAIKDYNHYHGITKKTPDFIGKDVTTFSKESVVTTFLQHNTKLTGVQAEQYADQFLEKYTDKKEKEFTEKEKARYDKANKKNTHHNAPSSPKKREQDKKYVYSLTYEGRKLAEQKTTREELVGNINSILKARKELNYEVKDKFYRLREKNL
jgi:conjugative relaxase-like TrwC/TraI family protein